MAVLELTLETFEKRIRDWCSVNGMSWRKISTKDPCVYCSNNIKPSRFTLEHVWPVSKGGSDSWENKVAACCHCNVFRSSKPLLEFLMKPGKSLTQYWTARNSPFIKGENNVP